VPTPTLAASLECCALRRLAFAQVDGFSAGYALSAQNGLDFFLRMRAAGLLIAWVPAVEAYALDDAAATQGYWVRTGEMVDGWSLRASWRDRLPGTPDVLPTPATATQRTNFDSANSFPNRTVKIAGRK
jgi:hypothetical protein